MRLKFVSRLRRFANLMLFLSSSRLCAPRFIQYREHLLPYPAAHHITCLGQRIRALGGVQLGTLTVQVQQQVCGPPWVERVQAR